MHKQLELSLLPEQCAGEAILLKNVRSLAGISPEQTIRIIRKSLDARRKPIRYHVLAEVSDEPIDPITFEFKQVAHAKGVAIIGAGPAGLFAALKLLELGLKPVIFERGKNVKDRRRDLALITRFNAVNPDSNYCFGEGGAGTYSDGKLYTRSSKRGDIKRILSLLVAHGAQEEILYEAHPHIGTNKLPGIITRIRETIVEYGGEIHFNSRLTDLKLDGNALKGIYVEDSTAQTGGKQFHAFDQVLLATGHSARDIFELLHSKGIAVEAKPFALGVRIEHPQELIDSIQYSCDTRGDYLPPAAYSIVNQSLGRGVFSFCMCPGGIIAPALTAPGEIVVNGWSPSKRNNPFANSGLVAAVGPEDYKKYAGFGALAALQYQREVEQACFRATGSLQAPAQRVSDFVSKRASSSLPDCSYLPGIVPYSLDQLLPQEISASLRDALTVFGRKMKGYVSADAVMVATESRTSSPVRIPRDKESLEHPIIQGLFPCGEGAGYAGGIVSAAMDGERCAVAINQSVNAV